MHSASSKQVKLKGMRTTISEYVLVKGDFTPQEAKNAILALVEDKIRHHRQRNFTIEERLGAVSEHSKERIEELRATLSELEDLIAYAEAHKKTLRISTDIKIEFL